MKTVLDILNNKLQNENTIDKNEMVNQAFTKMEKENLDYIIVMENNNCIGIMSEVDYMHKIILAKKNPKYTRVKEIMTNSICAVDIKEPIHKCLELMDSFKIRHLLVFEDFVFQNVITLHDLMHVSYENNLDHLIENDQATFMLSRNFAASYIF